MMKWVALLLLAGNLVYLGWELDRGTKALVANSPPALKIPAGSGTLKIIDEAVDMQELRHSYARQQPPWAPLPESR